MDRRAHLGDTTVSEQREQLLHQRPKTAAQILLVFERHFGQCDQGGGDRSIGRVEGVAAQQNECSGEVARPAKGLDACCHVVRR